MLPPQLTAQTLAHLLGEANCCWVLEDFHKVPESEKTQLAQVMKLFMDMADEYPVLKIIAIGAVETARQVIEYDREMRNRVAEIFVPLMSNAELTQVIAKGENLLNMSFSASNKEGIANCSSGLASVCHQLCLHVCHAGGIVETCNELFRVGQKEMTDAIAAYLDDCADTLKATFDQALNISRIRKYDNARLILQALQLFDQDGATRAELLSTIQKNHPNYSYNNLLYHLRALTSTEKGEIIQLTPATGRYIFSEPVFLAYIMAWFAKEAIASFNSEIDRVLEIANIKRSSANDSDEILAIKDAAEKLNKGDHTGAQQAFNRVGAWLKGIAKEANASSIVGFITGSISLPSFWGYNAPD